MSFINTRDSIGDAATVDGLVEHSLTELADDSVITVEKYACYSNGVIQCIKFPNVTSFGENSFQGTALHAIEIDSEGSSASLVFKTKSFYECSGLKKILINRSTVPVINNTDAFGRSPIITRRGAVYVPSNMVNTYKSATNWSTLSILPIDCYSSNSLDSITDSWATILADTNPSEHYSVGDTKTLALSNDLSVVCQIVGFNKDILANDNIKYARISWVIQDFYAIHAMNVSSVGTLGGWENSSMRSYLISDVLPLLEASDVGASLQTVIKTYRTKYTTDGDTTKSCSDKIWIPSVREFYGSTATNAEETGPTYSLDSNWKGKTDEDYQGSTRWWWLRTPYNNSNFYYVNSDGTSSNGSSYQQFGAAFGFCTGISSFSDDTITDSWATILADTNPSVHYSIGDTKSVNINNKIVTFQIVAFNSDILASDSTKTARITWVSKGIYTNSRMNSSNTTSGGWENSYLRNYLISNVLPLLEASAVGNDLQTVTKTYITKHTDDGDTTKSCSDKIWIPSVRETGVISTDNYIESSGPVYSSAFDSNASRVKYYENTAKAWLLRSAYNGTQFDTVNAGGTSGFVNASTTGYGVVIGFCTGVSS